MSSLTGLRSVSGYEQQQVKPDAGELVADFNAGWAAVGGDGVVTPNQVTKRLFEHEADGFERAGLGQAWKNPVVQAYITQQNIRNQNPGKPFSPDAPIPPGQIYHSMAGTPLREAVRMATNMPDFENRLRQELAAMNANIGGSNKYTSARGSTALAVTLPVGPEPGEPGIRRA